MADEIPEDGPLTLDQAYAVLEVSDEHKGNLDKVKMAYRKLCLRWHPDKNPPEKSEKQRFTRITAAYHTSPPTTSTTSDGLDRTRFPRCRPWRTF